MSNKIMSKAAEANTLVRTLAGVADQVEPDPDWDRLVADIRRGKASEPAKRLSTRPRLLATAAALLVIGAGGVALTTTGGPSPSEISATRPNFVLPGEIVLSEDPLIVVGALGPEPQFDTSELGRQISFKPVSELGDSLTDLISRIGMLYDPAKAAPEVVKIVALGTVEGEPWMIMIANEATSASFADESRYANRRTRWLISPTGGGSGGGSLVPVDSLELIVSPTIEQDGPVMGGGYTTGFATDWVQVSFMPAGTAVVSYVDDDQHLWMRPRSGAAAFPAHFEDGESFMVQAFDAGGVLIGGWSETVRLD